MIDFSNQSFFVDSDDDLDGDTAPSSITSSNQRIVIPKRFTNFYQPTVQSKAPSKLPQVFYKPHTIRNLNAQHEKREKNGLEYHSQMHKIYLENRVANTQKIQSTIQNHVNSVLMYTYDNSFKFHDELNLIVNSETSDPFATQLKDNSIPLLTTIHPFYAPDVYM